MCGFTVQTYLTVALGLYFIGCSQSSSSTRKESADEIPQSSGAISPPHNVTDPNVIMSTFYTEWSQWGPCSKRCQQSRVRKCKPDMNCGSSWFKEKRPCKRKGKCSSKSYRSFKLLGFRKKDSVMEKILYKLLYGPWSQWTPCSKSCKKRRYRNCVVYKVCGVSYIQEERVCRKSRANCTKQYLFNTLLPQEKLLDTEADESVRKIKNITAIVIGNTTSGVFGRQRTSNAATLDSMKNMCGDRPPRGSYRIVGGQIAQKHSWPWMRGESLYHQQQIEQVAILEKSKEQFCGGTLIAPQWVLTAAHCVRKKKRKRKIFVRVGEHDIYAKDAGEKLLKLSKDFPHPDYDFDTITNDIALLKLERPIQANRTDKIDFACLPQENDEFADKTKCYIVGWGKENNTDIYGSNKLQEAEVPLVSRKRCQKVFDYVIHESQICAGYKKGGLDSCAGDSGGPLLCSKQENGMTRWFVYGVTSYGEGCAEKGKYGIYTKVTNYLNWIHSIVESN